MSREEDAYVIERMGKLLAEIAIIVNGPEPHDTLWSYHDLPEKVRALKQAPPAMDVDWQAVAGDQAMTIAMLQIDLSEARKAPPAAAVPEGYALVPVEPTPEMVAAALASHVPVFRREVNAERSYRAMLAAAQGVK